MNERTRRVKYEVLQEREPRKRAGGKEQIWRVGGSNATINRVINIILARSKIRRV